MGKASSAKKLARAARAGKVSKGRERRDVGFPLVIALVILVGSSLVLYARNDRAEAVAPRLNVDHWHAAYGFYNCAKVGGAGFEDPIIRGEGWPDPTGIHTHDDGVIHIHPFSSSATGNRARLKVLFETMDVKFTDDEVVLTSGVTMKDGTDCDGKTARLKVARFQVDRPDQAPQIIESKLADVRFLADREAFTIALIPDEDNDKIPIPPTASQLDELAAVDTNPSPTAPATAPGSTIPGDTSPSVTVTIPATTAPGDPSTTTAGGSPTTISGSTTTSR